MNLTDSIKDPSSPVRAFLDEHFKIGRDKVTRRYAAQAPPIALDGSKDANAGTVGTAADWLLRFLISPQPDLRLAAVGASYCQKVGMNLQPALAEIMKILGVPGPKEHEGRGLPVAGPQASGVDSVSLAKACWALALLTEVRRAGLRVLERGPLAQFRGRTVSGAELLALASPAAIDQLVRLRGVFETSLLPQLVQQKGPWSIGPTFVGSKLLSADADLIIGGFLFELKVRTRHELQVQDLFQLVGYALLDFDDRYRLTDVAIFSARYAHLTKWHLSDLLAELAGRQVDLGAVREEFRQVLLRLPRPSSPTVAPSSAGDGSIRPGG
ncbi:MAG: hypothetical protein JNJ46_24680 [Myxococcales bacterium]|nr:hypothetical protein [Myxococcales bacterium]